MKIQVRKAHLPLILLSIFGLIIILMGVTNHYLFRTVTHDYGNYNFAFWDYSHFRISQMPTFRGNFLQDHFSLTLMYFVPIYWLLNWLTGTYTLIIIQNVLITIAAWYSYKIIRLKSDNIWLWAGVIVYYFVLFGRYSSLSADVNLAIISACFIPIFIYYFEIKKYLISTIILILSLLSRENVPLWFIFIFAVLIFNHRKDRKAVLLGSMGIVLSIVYFIALFKIIIPSIESKEIGYSLFNYSALGNTPGEAIAYIIRNPVESIKLFFVNHLDDPAYNKVKAEFYWTYILSGGLILFLRPKYLIWFIPIVAQKVLNDSYIRWGIATYYSVEIVTLLPLSVFLVLAEIKNSIIQKSLIVLTCLASVAMTIYKMDRSNNTVPWTLNPSKVKIYSTHFFEAPFDVKKVNNILNLIPAKAKVSASTMFLPHLAQRQNIYYFPTVKDAEYIVFSVFDNNYLFSQYQNEEKRDAYLQNPEWEIVAQEHPVYLLQKKDKKLNQDSPKENIWAKTDTLKCDFEYFDDNKKHILFNNNEKADTLKNISSTVSLSGNHSIVLTEKNPYSHSYKIINLEKVTLIQLTAWFNGVGDNGLIVGSNANGFYKTSSSTGEVNSQWRQISLSFWIPQKPIPEFLSVYFWNKGKEPAYFDDLQIVKHYKQQD